MELRFGNEVIDRNGKPLGTVDHLVRNTWTGEISKFVVRRKVLDKDLFLSAENVQEVAEDTVRLNLSIEELSQM
jgi:sporulation protein YlmC with PRC-barrel domain